MQLGSKGKVTNGTAKLCSKPIFMSAFLPAIRADKHLMWGKRGKDMAAGDTLFGHSVSPKHVSHRPEYQGEEMPLGGEDNG